MEATRHTGKLETVYNLRVADWHTYFVGSSEWGFSVWAHNSYDVIKARVSETMSRIAARFQFQATGTRSGWAWLKDGVKFDGFKKGVLLEAKGLGYAKLLEGEATAYSVGWRLLNQAERQLKAAGETPLRWIFAEREAADTVRRMFRVWGFDAIEVVHVPIRF